MAYSGYSYMADAAAPQGVSGFRPMFVLIGDSITEFSFLDGGWGNTLASWYNRRVRGSWLGLFRLGGWLDCPPLPPKNARTPDNDTPPKKNHHHPTKPKADVVNRGFGGYNTRMGLQVLDEVINSFGAGRIKLVTLCFGANDAALPGSKAAGLAVPLDEFTANLKAMVDKLRAKGIRNIVIVAPPPVNQDVLQGTRTASSTARYAAAAVSLARAYGLTYVDAFKAIGANANWRTASMLEDGLHLSPAGNKVLAANVITAIARGYPELKCARERESVLVVGCFLLL
jgi:lysophospholipase L1-like esterase